MKIIVNPHKLEIEKSPVNEKEINITKCEFVFNDIEQDLVKKAFFTLKDTTYEQIIVNGECDIPSEVLEEQGQIEIGVIAYQVEDEEYIKRYNPSPAYFTTWKGSLKEAENSSKPTPSQIEQIESEIATIRNDIIDLDNNKQDTLVSGENIKTINNQDLLGSGNIDLNETYYTKGEVDSIKTTIEGEIPTKVSQLDNDSEYITKEVNSLTYYTLATNTGSTIELGINTSTYVMTLNLKNEAGTTISTQSIDLPLESVVVSGSYDSVNKSIILTLQSGSTITIPVGDLVSGLQSEITPSNKLSSDLVDDTGHTNKFVTSSDITNWNNKIDSSALIDYVKNTDYASSSKGGVIKTGNYNLAVGSTGSLYVNDRTYDYYQNSMTSVHAISKGTLENVITGKELTNKTYVDEENATQNTQIEALQEENNYLNSIIDQLPKVSGEGEYITLNNTIEGKLGLELGSSELEQETTTGKNLCENKTNNAVIATIPAGTYTFSLFSNIAGGYALKNGSSSGSTISGINYIGANTKSSATFTISEETSIFINGFSNTSGKTFVDDTIEWQLETGSTATDYEPYTNGASPNPSYPQPIHTISGDNEVVVQNKNLFKEWISGSINPDTGVISSTPRNLTNPIKVQPNTTYTLWREDTGFATYAIEFDKNDNWLAKNTIVSADTSRTFTTNANTSYVRLYQYISYAPTNKAQLEINSTATSYIEHKEQVKHINLPVENKFDKDTISSVGSGTNNNGVITATGGNCIVYFGNNPISVNSGDTIYFSADIKLNANSTGSFNNINDGVNASTTKILNPTLSTLYQRYQTSITYDNATSITRMLIQIASLNGTAEISNIMISKSKSLSYTPYGVTPIEYCEIGDYKDEFIKNSGKNLCNITSASPRYYSNGLPDVTSSLIIVDSYNSNNITFHSITANYNIVLSNVIQLKPSTQYTIKFSRTSTATNNQWFIYNYDNGYTLNYRDNNTNTLEKTFTTNSVGQIALAFGHGNVTGNTTISNIMLNEGLSAIEYEPYGTNQWYLKKNIGKVVLDATWNWYTNGTTNYQVTLTGNNKLDLATSGVGISNYFRVGTSGTDIFLYPILQSGTDYIRLSNAVSKWETINDLKTFLINNTVYFYYPLANPTYILLNDTLQDQINDIYYTMKSYKEQTNISQVNNDLGFTIKAGALLDLNSLIG